MTDQQMAQRAINTIRTLSIDAVQQAKSGHPGTPMALAPLVYTIWNRVMRFDPKDPIWPNRDRFVLLNGHASMLLWSILHLTGVQAVTPIMRQLGIAPKPSSAFANGANAGRPGRPRRQPLWKPIWKNAWPSLTAPKSTGNVCGPPMSSNGCLWKSAAVSEPCALSPCEAVLNVSFLPSLTV